jgi:hypothetical protein
MIIIRLDKMTVRYAIWLEIFLIPSGRFIQRIFNL